jgi:hypothetical protein
MTTDVWAYDEEQELTRYLWDNYHELFTPQEQQLSRVIVARELSEQRTSSNRRVNPLDYPGTFFQDALLNQALSPGAAQIRQQAALRVLLSQRERITITRCPRCQRIVKRLHSLQCYWCGLDWHDGRELTPRR